MKSTKMEKFQEKGLKDLSALRMTENEMTGVIGGDGEEAIRFTINWDGWFNGNLLDGRLDEFDKPQAVPCS